MNCYRINILLQDLSNMNLVIPFCTVKLVKFYEVWPFEILVRAIKRDRVPTLCRIERIPKFNKPTTEVCLAHQFVLLRIILTYCRSYNWITDSLWCHKIWMSTKIMWWSLICLFWLQVWIQSCHAWFEFHARSKQVVVCKQ